VIRAEFPDERTAGEVRHELEGLLGEADACRREYLELRRRREPAREKLDSLRRKFRIVEAIEDFAGGVSWGGLWKYLPEKYAVRRKGRRLSVVVHPPSYSLDAFLTDWLRMRGGKADADKIIPMDWREALVEQSFFLGKISPSLASTHIAEYIARLKKSPLWARLTEEERAEILSWALKKT
jgi:hypothetical protein